MSGKRQAKGCAHRQVGPEAMLTRMDWIADRHQRGMQQRRCDACGFWFFRDEFGPGWNKAKRNPA